MAFDSEGGHNASALTYHALESPSASKPMAQVRRRRFNIEVVEDALATAGPTWMFPGGGNAQRVHVPDDELDVIKDKLSKPKHQLGEWPATSICGNDILSSVLYSASLVAAKAGKLMPVPLIMVSLVLYFFRFIYEEVVTAIPLNGGSYNVLLNTTSKRTAALAASLGILSYVATGVVSGTSALSYLGKLVSLNVTWWTVALLLFFALLALIGITESSKVAMVIFFHHALVLTVLAVTEFVYAVKHPHIFTDNMKVKYPDVDFCGSTISGNVGTAILFGFGASMLGITGFESSAQFVEEQAPGVFRKTLRNMWCMVSVFNISLGFLTLALLPLEGKGGIYESADALLAEAALVAGGEWLKKWVAIDAFVVLAGAVLTSYVGITGLVRRLANDRVLPSFLARQNKLRGTNHFIIILYFLLASSLVLILDADATILGGVYTYAFLGLMTLFASGCMLLKAKRADIPRDISAPWWVVVFGIIMVVIAIFANLLGDPKILVYFALYFIAVTSVMFVMLERVSLLRALLSVMKKVMPSRHRSTSDTAIEHTGARGGRTIANAIVGINEAPIVFFCKSPNLTIINKAIVYVRRNEQTHNLRIIHLYSDEEATAETLDAFKEVVGLFDHIYPKIRIDFVSIQGEFSPAMVEWVAQSMNIPTNMMFIKQPSNSSAHQVSSSGVRVITA
ncbi:TPA: hypothetical protein N0F65_007447 [Lagenidium giganteum]|uniref:Transmembrane protein n=1 Tax=Lagenidium giganteum TaxID=4803 RepID=A0AAV2ZRX9_9STRA|nr:TPA: hypothetical protein N0F65_007447 [Lagenidium giganteum]